MNYLEQIKSWKQNSFDKETQEEIVRLEKENPTELEDAFYKNLEFGTGGIRGIMGVGPNRINKYTLGKSTQGLCLYLKEQYKNQSIKVVVAYDCRNNSKELATVVASIFSANNIECFLFSDLRPTPELSFAIRHLKAQCGVMITASHNPPEYNGYKVYWEDGGQIVTPHDKNIIDAINNIDYSDINFEKNDDLISSIDKGIDDAFCKKSIEIANFNTANKKDFKIVFTSLHGTSITLMPTVLNDIGYTNTSIIEEQATPDGNFPTVDSPNPEEPEAFKLALNKAKEIDAEIVIGTDPDADRVGIGVKNIQGEIELIDGNQLMTVLTYFLLERQKEKLNENNFIASTIVSTPLLEKMAKDYNIGYINTLTGFKWIGKSIFDNPTKTFIAGGEESFGYMVGDWVRDKDAITTALLACEVANWAKNNNSSFYELLIDCYVKYGFYKERLLSITKKGKEGSEYIKNKMSEFRQNPPTQIAGINVVKIEDYDCLETFTVSDNTREKLNFPKSNVLIFFLEDESRIAVRPSGTEPKIKFYYSVKETLTSINTYEKTAMHLNEQLDTLVTQFSI